MACQCSYRSPQWVYLGPVVERRLQSLRLYEGLSCSLGPNLSEHALCVHTHSSLHDFSFYTFIQDPFPLHPLPQCFGDIVLEISPGASSSCLGILSPSLCLSCEVLRACGSWSFRFYFRFIPDKYEDFIIFKDSRFILSCSPVLCAQCRE